MMYCRQETLYDDLGKCWKCSPNEAALICGNRSLTYAQLNARARRVANALSALGIQAGDRVAVKQGYGDRMPFRVLGGSRW